MSNQMTIEGALKLARDLSITTPDQAKNVYRQILATFPTLDIAAIPLANLLAEDDPAEAIAILERAKPTATENLVGWLAHYIRIKEWEGRAAHGKLLHHVTQLEDWPLNYARHLLADYVAAAQALARLVPNKAINWVFVASGLITLGDVAGANAALETARAAASPSPLSNMRFCDILPCSLEMPDVTTVKPLTAKEAFFIGCDTNFLRDHAMPLLRSMAATSPGLPVHIHLFGACDDPAEVLGLNLQVSLSTEDPGPFIAARNIPNLSYYGAVRMVRFAELVERSGATLWLMDADAIARNDPAQLFGQPEPVALRLRAGRIQVWNQVSACLVKVSPEGLPFAKAAADIIKAEIDRLWWGMDQYALLAAYLALRPKTALIGPETADVAAFSDDSIFWFTAGRDTKRALLDRAKTSQQAVEFRRYAEAFDRFRSRKS